MATILLAHTDPGVRRLLQRELSNLHHLVLTVHTAIGAHCIVDQTSASIDLAVVDSLIPGSRPNQSLASELIRLDIPTVVVEPVAGRKQSELRELYPGMMGCVYRTGQHYDALAQKIIRYLV